VDTSQLRTILWLRWRLSRNQWSRGGAFNAALIMVLLVAGVVVGVFGAVFGLLAGAVLLGDVAPLKLLGLWDAIVMAFLFVWMIGLVSEIQRAEMIDIARMLHLPVR